MLVVILDSLHIIKNCTGPTALDPKDEKLLVPKGMFGWMDFMEDEKKKKVENRRENEWEGCLVERGRRREKWWDPAVFSLGLPKFNLSKMERK